MQEDISSKTGEGIYRRAALSLNEITFNGNDGVFFDRDKDSKKDDKTGKYPKTQITQPGESLEVVFLKIRRVLSSYSKKASMRTNEHNHKGEMVCLYKPDGKEVGVAKDIRENYPMLKTQQIVYCFIPKEEKVVRLIIKGSSLGSDAKHEKEVLKFYDYLQAFGSSEHAHEFVTKLVPIEEEGPQGTYYAISFVKGEKLDQEELAKVKVMINDIHERVTAIDDRMKENFGKPVVTKEELPIIQEGEEYDEDEKKSSGKHIVDPEAVRASIEANKTPMEEIPVVEDEIQVKDIPF